MVLSIALRRSPKQEPLTQRLERPRILLTPESRALPPSTSSASTTDAALLTFSIRAAGRSLAYLRTHDRKRMSDRTKQRLPCARIGD